MGLIRSLYDNLELIKNHLRTNYKTIIIATFGLIIALSILSSSVLFINNQKTELLDDLIEDEMKSWNIQEDRYYTKNKNESFGVLTNDSLNKNNLLNKVDNYFQFSSDSYRPSLGSKSGLLTTNKTNLNRSIEIKNIFNFPYLSIFQDYFVPGSEFKNNSKFSQNAVLMLNTDIFNDSIWSPKINDKFEFVFIVQKELIPVNNITITGIILINSTELSNIKLANIEANKADFQGNLIFVSNLTSIYDEKSFVLNSNERDIYIISKYYYIFDLTKFNGFEIPSIIKNFDIMELQLRNLLYNNGFRTFEITNTVIHPLIQVEMQISKLYLNVILFALPVILIAIFLAYYSFSFIRKQKLKILTVYLTRGISRFQFIAIIIAEMVISVLIAIFAGILLSLPVTQLVVRSSGFLIFENDLFFSISLISIDLVILIAQFGIFLAFFINFLQISSYLTFSIKDAEKESVEDRENPFWKRKYLDIVFLAIGLTFYLISAYSIDLGNIIPTEMLSIFTIPAPILIILGAVMVISRIFPLLTQIISTFLWKRRGNLISFSLKNITMRRQSSTRAVIIISLSFAFLVSFLAFPFSFFAHQETLIHYNIGSDIQIKFKDNKLNYTIIDKVLENFTNEIEAYSPVIVGRLAGNRFMAVNTSTYEKASWMESYFTSDLNQSMKELQSDNFTMLIYEETLKASKRKIGEEFVWFEFKNQSQSELGPTQDNLDRKNSSIFTFNVSGSFKYWPNLLRGVPANPRINFYGVISLETLNALKVKLGPNYADYIENEELLLYINPKSSLNETKFKTDLLKSEFISRISLFSSERDQFTKNVAFFTLIGQINSDIIYTTGIIFLTIIMFGVLQLIERSKEVATERAIGMSLSQTFTIIFIESIWLLIFGIIAGVFLGYFLSSLFLLGVTLGTGFPPFVMIYPFHLIGGTILLFITFSLIFSFIPAYLSTRINVSKLLRVE